MKVEYSSQTVNHPNPIARFAHRHRNRKSILLANNLVKSNSKNIVDYGCGEGIFVDELRRVGFKSAYGYEPYMEQTINRSYIVKDKKLIPARNVELVTLFETIEHLDTDELDSFFDFCRLCLKESGKILISAPIEIGPAVIFKDIVRSILFKRTLEYSFIELVKCGLFGMSTKRSKNIKGSHKGFDFRKIITLIRKRYGKVKVLGYGPLPINTWYGNSQVYFQVKIKNL